MAARGEIGRRIALARREAGLTQPQLGDRIGVTLRAVQGYEAGAVIPYRRMDAIAGAVNRSSGWLLYGHEPDAARLEALEARVEVLERRLESLADEVAALAAALELGATRQAAQLARLLAALADDEPQSLGRKRFRRGRTGRPG